MKNNYPPFGELRGWTLIFSEDGFRRALQHAEDRNRGKLEFHHPYVPHGVDKEKYLLDRELEGVVSEAVFETRYWHLGARADWNVYPNHGDKGCDFIVNGCKIQTRGFNSPTKRISWESKRPIHFDVECVALFKDFEHYGRHTRSATLLRWCTTPELTANKPVVIKNPYQPLYLVENHDAHGMPSLEPFLMAWQNTQESITLPLPTV